MCMFYKSNAVPKLVIDQTYPVPDGGGATQVYTLSSNVGSFPTCSYCIKRHQD